MHTCVEGSKRQLPPWMMQKVGATATHVSDSNNAVETNCYIKKGDIIKTNATKKDHKSESSKRSSNLRAKCEVMGRKKLDQQDGSSDKVTQKKRKGDRSKDRDQRSSIKKRKKLEDPSHGCYDVSPVSDDAMDLTLEDLMAIAEQYVKDYENKDRKEISSRQHESKWQFQVTNETGHTLDSPCKNENSSKSGREDLSHFTSTTGELIATSTSQTGDPAQDMLDLFLGPLLRKTLEKEKSKSIVKNVEITHEFTRQSQDKLAGEEIVPLTKKRNTFKDKVAMFLDQDM
ncbi:uncharacterized protein LOC114378252 isoform X1 [Glycine soja]|uniref:Uncharacterized protein n=1 Tax=Glycine soja TaxID=3848 RepID=A0A445HJZ7_GLYSO|nr:uncharacterized protein LOC114378252 isoform X1 [Glycine soja]XP_028192616.1 uncharacterized protein LOC114378252 isoform X1 [Glycine soja]KHN05420.1 hypothetical protein glysoja_020385 [Glycine soja]RZB74003.1 hypothetical protein D0Y65_033210 [Glycine soja]RZB74004.1 hypothetical protein D0Y65_033210 [Glycine soja]